MSCDPMGCTRSVWEEWATSPSSSYTSLTATPTAVGARVVAASRQTHSPTGSRRIVTVRSVFMKPHWVGSSAAEAPLAESTQHINRARPRAGSPGRRSIRGRIHTVAGPGSSTDPLIHRHSTAST